MSKPLDEMTSMEALELPFHELARLEAEFVEGLGSEVRGVAEIDFKQLLSDFAELIQYVVELRAKIYRDNPWLSQEIGYQLAYYRRLLVMSEKKVKL